MNPRKLASLFQFSIRGLFLGVTILSVGIAALLNANGWWEAAAWGGTIFFLAIAIMLAIYRQAERRAFWLGFTLLGWLYLAVLIYSWMHYANPQYARSDPLTQSSLLTTRLSQLAYSAMLPESKRQPSIPVEGNSAPMTVYFGVNDGQTATTSTPTMMMAPLVGTVPRLGSGSPLPGTSLAFTPSGVLMTANPNYVPVENFTHIAHTLWLLVIAAVGGKTCELIYRTRPAA